jgi:hypothetical protein
MAFKLLAGVSILLLAGTAFAMDFDRSGNGVPDIRISPEGVLIDNDEDGLFDHGFLDTDADGDLDSIWVDRDDDGIVKQGGEVKSVKAEVPFTPLSFAVNMSVEQRSHTDALRYYIDYDADGLPDEIAVDTDRDGRMEADSFGAYDASDNLALYGMQLLDFDHNGTFDEGRFQSSIADPQIKTMKFSKQQLPQLMSFSR